VRSDEHVDDDALLLVMPISGLGNGLLAGDLTVLRHASADVEEHAVLRGGAVTAPRQPASSRTSRSLRAKASGWPA
jgi:hypothetical protein